MIKYVEELINLLSIARGLNKFDSSVACSLADQYSMGNGFTEKQRGLVITLIKKYAAILYVSFNVDVRAVLQNPVYKFPVRQINNSKHISIIDHETWGRVIKMEFPFNQPLVDSIRQQRSSLDFASWDGHQKAWLFNLSEKSIMFVNCLVMNDGFELDEEFQDYVNQISEIHNSIESYVPMVVLDNGIPTYKNTHRSMPPLETTDIVEAVFTARKSGITVWDDSAAGLLKSKELNPQVEKFLNLETMQHHVIDSRTNSVHCIADIVKYMHPGLFILPGGSELLKLKMVHEFLLSQGYKNNEMSVLFRLPSNSNKEFNEYIKLNKLNSPVTDSTKFVFVSFKITKPLVRANIKFNCVINLGHSTVHYNMREFVKNQPNLIYYCEQ